MLCLYNTDLCIIPLQIFHFILVTFFKIWIGKIITNVGKLVYFFVTFGIREFPYTNPLLKWLTYIAITIQATFVIRANIFSCK